MDNLSAIAFPYHLVIINTRHKVNNPQWTRCECMCTLAHACPALLFHLEITSELYQGVAWTRSLLVLQTHSIALLQKDDCFMCVSVCMQNYRLCQKGRWIAWAYGGHVMQWDALCVRTHEQDRPLSLIQSLDLMFIIMGNALILFNPV